LEERGVIWENREEGIRIRREVTAVGKQHAAVRPNEKRTTNERID